jgi:NAD(P)-dependent dehydrogenase (short-subunit alcohol dehydrogenase family)
MPADAQELAVVVGATGTLGGAIARRLVERGLGVVAVGRDASKLDALTAESDRLIPCRTDVGLDTAIDDIHAAVDRPVRIAVMAAGLPVAGSALTIETGGLAAGANIKLDGLLRLLRAIDHRLVDDSRLAILTGFLGLQPGRGEAGPGAINAAVHNLLRQLSEIYGPRGTTVHAICPGPVDTARLRALAASIAAERDIPADAVLDDYRAGSPLGELVTVDQVVWATELLLERHARALHGSTLMVAGGRLRGNL